MHWRKGLLAGLACCALMAPAKALVEPEVEAWANMVGDAREVCRLPGSEILAEGLDELGGLGSALMSAPLDDLMVELEERRNLEFKYFTPWHVKDRDELRAWFKIQLAKEYTPADVARDEGMLKALGLVPESFQLVPFLEELLTSQVAGVYDPSTDQFFLVDMKSGQSLRESTTDLATKALMARAGLSVGDQTSIVTIHELDHALGGQHFPLLKTFGQNPTEWTTDQQMGIQALIEGDATFVMMDHQNKLPASQMGAGTVILNADMMASIIGMMAMFPIPLPGMGEFGSAPIYFQKGLMFPYLNGAELVSALRHATTDWSAVDTAYGNPPTSTEQVLHPSDYLYVSRKPTYPDFSRLPKTVGAWSTLDDDVGGEFLVRAVLEQFGVEGYAAGAEGWDGDQLRIYRAGRKLAFLWALNWDTDEDAEQFMKLTRDRLPFVVERTGPKSVLLSKGFSAPQLSTLKSAIPRAAAPSAEGRLNTLIQEK